MLVPRLHYSAAFNIIQQPSILVSLQVGLLATMLSLSVSGLSLASTYSQIETLRRDSNALSKAIAGLAVTTGRSFPSQFEELISEGKYLIIYLRLRLILTPDILSPKNKGFTLSFRLPGPWYI